MSDIFSVKKENKDKKRADIKIMDNFTDLDDLALMSDDDFDIIVKAEMNKGKRPVPDPKPASDTPAPAAPVNNVKPEPPKKPAGEESEKPAGNQEKKLYIPKSLNEPLSEVLEKNGASQNQTTDNGSKTRYTPGSVSEMYSKITRPSTPTAAPSAGSNTRKPLTESETKPKYGPKQESDTKPKYGPGSEVRPKYGPGSESEAKPKYGPGSEAEAKPKYGPGSEPRPKFGPGSVAETGKTVSTAAPVEKPAVKPAVPETPAVQVKHAFVPTASPDAADFGVPDFVPTSDNTKDDGPMSYTLLTKFHRLPHKSVAPSAKKLVAICSSTGGPKALQRIVPYLPGNLNAAVVAVQHMSKGFTASLARRLDERSELTVMEAVEHEKLKKGRFYLAKGGEHLQVIQRKSGMFLQYADQPARSGLKPCADVMFESLLELEGVDEFICVVLTGMGSDGTRGIGKLSEKKNCYVIAQDEPTSTVYGMPGMIYKAGLTDEVLPLDKIAEAITRVVGTRSAI